MPVRQIIVGAIFATLIASIIAAIVPPERLGEAVMNGLYKLAKAIAELAKKAVE